MSFTFFDCEATGIEPQADRVTQIAIVSSDLAERFESLVNPGRPIPPEVQELTGITDEKVLLAPKFEALAETIAVRLIGRTLVGFGCNAFDVPLLAAEFERAGVEFEWPPVIDAGDLFKIHEPRNLTAALRHYCGRPHDGAHGALADAIATRAVFLTQLGRYAELANLSPAELAKASRFGREMADPAGKLAWVDGMLCFNTARNRGVPVVDDIGYAEWMLRSDFPAATKRLLRKELEDAGPDDAAVDYSGSSDESFSEVPF